MTRSRPCNDWSRCSRNTGGTVLHLYMNERISSTQACKRLVKHSLEIFRLPYITITPIFSICPMHGYFSGEYEYSPVCDDEVWQGNGMSWQLILEKNQGIYLDDEKRTRYEVWTRIMGYHRPVSAFTHGKKAEHTERVYFMEGC